MTLSQTNGLRSDKGHFMKLKNFGAKRSNIKAIICYIYRFCHANVKIERKKPTYPFNYIRPKVGKFWHHHKKWKNKILYSNLWILDSLWNIGTIVFRDINKFYRHNKFIKVNLSYVTFMNICHANVKIAKPTKYSTYNKKLK